MSGFDNSQPVTDEAVLKNDDDGSDRPEGKKAPAKMAPMQTSWGTPHRGPDEL